MSECPIDYIVDPEQLGLHILGSLKPYTIRGLIHDYPLSFTGEDVMKSLLMIDPMKHPCIIWINQTTKHSFQEKDYNYIGSILIGTGMIERIHRSRLPYQQQQPQQTTARSRLESIGSISSGSVVTPLVNTYFSTFQFKKSSNHFYRFGSTESRKRVLYVEIHALKNLVATRTSGTVLPIVKVELGSISVRTNQKTAHNQFLEIHERFVFFVDDDVYGVGNDRNTKDPAISRMNSKFTFLRRPHFLSRGLGSSSSASSSSINHEPGLDITLLEHYHIQDHFVGFGSISMNNIISNYTFKYGAPIPGYFDLDLPNHHQLQSQLGEDSYGLSFQVKASLRICLSNIPLEPQASLDTISISSPNETRDLSESLDVVAEDINPIGGGAGNDDDSFLEGDDVSVYGDDDDPILDVPNVEDLDTSISSSSSKPNVTTEITPMSMYQTFMSDVKYATDRIVDIETQAWDLIDTRGPRIALSEPRIVYDIILSGVNPITRGDYPNTLNLAAFELVAPRFPGLVARVCAPLVYAALATVSMGFVRAENAFIARKPVMVDFEAFSLYSSKMAIEWDRILSSEARYAKQLYKFESRGMQTIPNDGERVLHHEDFVRGAVLGKSSIMNLGTLYITTHSLLYVRERIVTHREGSHLDLTRAIRATTNDGRTFWGLVVFFKGKHATGTTTTTRLSPEKDGPKEDEISNVLFRFTSEKVRDMNLKIINEVIAFQNFKKSYIEPLLQGLKANQTVVKRIAELATDVLIHVVTSMKVIPSVMEIKSTMMKVPMSLQVVSSKQHYGSDSTSSSSSNNNNNNNNYYRQSMGHSSNTAALTPNIFTKLQLTSTQHDATSLSGLMAFLSVDEPTPNATYTTSGPQKQAFSNVHQDPSLTSLACRTLAAHLVLAGYRDISLPW